MMLSMMEPIGHWSPLDTPLLDIQNVLEQLSLVEHLQSYMVGSSTTSGLLTCCLVYTIHTLDQIDQDTGHNECVHHTVHQENSPTKMRYE